MTGEVESRRIRVMLAEDHPDFRRLMESLLGGQADVKLVAQAGSLAEARKHAAVVRFDVAVLDLSLPDGNGVDLIVDLRRENPDVVVLILSATSWVAGVRPSLTTLLLLRVSAGAAGEIQVQGVFADVLVPQILNWEYPGCMSEEQWPPGVGVLGAGPISQAAPRRQRSATRKATSWRSARGRFASS